KMFEELQKRARARELLKNWTDGRIKMYVAWKTLTLRRSHADLFSEGEYIPLRAAGTRQDHIIAFARRLGDQWCFVAVPRLVAKLTRAGAAALGAELCRVTMFELLRGAH